MFICAQEGDQGINFQNELNWQQVVAKAKKEKKYIFVDCYATWCGPCKKMDKEVYPSQKVGAFFNNKFISIKLQMDSTKQDNEEVKKWHQTAADFMKLYKVNSFPTFLYFSPSGKILHKDIGGLGEEDFLTNAGKVFNPDNQYYTLLNNYISGKRQYATMAKLASSAVYFGDIDMAKKIGIDYIDNYLNKKSEAELYTPIICGSSLSF